MFYLTAYAGQCLLAHMFPSYHLWESVHPFPSVAHASVHKQSGPLSTSSAGSLSRPQPSQGSAGGGPMPNLTRGCWQASDPDGCSQQHQSLAPWPFQGLLTAWQLTFPREWNHRKESQDEATVFLFFELIKIGICILIAVSVWSNGIKHIHSHYHYSYSKLHQPNQSSKL